MQPQVTSRLHATGTAMHSNESVAAWMTLQNVAPVWHRRDPQSKHGAGKASLRCQRPPVQTRTLQKEQTSVQGPPQDAPGFEHGI